MYHLTMQFELYLLKLTRRMAILGATSGDTGSAAIAGVRGKPNIDCFILYPRGSTQMSIKNDFLPNQSHYGIYVH